MKKFLLILALFASICTTVFAQNTVKKSGEPKEGWSEMDYDSIPILKILESREGYVIIYQKNQTGVGSTVVPKAWAKGTPENPRKLKFRKLAAGLTKPYMTIVTKGGEFHRVILTIPMNKSNPVWGSLHEIKEGLDKENMDDVKL